MVEFKIGDICLLRPHGYEGTMHKGPYRVIIRGVGHDDFDWTVESLCGKVYGLFHPCHAGPIQFLDEVGRWCHNHELELDGPRPPTRFGKFIQRIEGK